MITGELMNGGDGNGIAATLVDGQTTTVKTARKAYDMVYDKSGRYRYSASFRQLRKMLPETLIVQGHTRKATNGESKNVDNLHPFAVGHVTGMHNGTISNYKDLWNTNPIGNPVSDNDSEVIFAMLNHYNPELSDPKEIANVVSEMYGSLAISAVSSKNPSQLLLLSRERPLFYYEDKVTGILWYSSSSEMLSYAGICVNSNPKRLREEGMFVSATGGTRPLFSVMTQPREVPYYRPYHDRTKTVCMFCNNTREVATTELRGMSDMRLDHWMKGTGNVLYVKDGEVYVRCPVCTPKKTKSFGRDNQ